RHAALVHDPHVAAVDELFELAAPLARDGFLDLVRHQVFVGRALDVAEDADGLREGRELHAREHEGDRGVFLVRVVDEAVRFVQARLAPQLNHFGERPLHADAFVAVLAEDHRTPVLKIQNAFGSRGAFGEGVERAVVEDVAVLVDLDEGDALVAGRRLDDRPEVFDVNVYGARDEGRLRGDGERERVDRVVYDAHRRGLRLLAALRGRAVLPLRQPVDAVVEEYVVEVEVAPDGVHEVVAADRERVAVARDDPDGEVRV